MLTGYQRQHRKAITYIPTENSDPRTTDQYTKTISNTNNQNGILEQYSKACELAAVSGMVLMQPYLDFTDQDPAQGDLKLKVWEYNSFLVDPYFREPDMSDAQFCWTQEYISKKEAMDRFPDKINAIQPMSGAPQRYGNFYFLPENYNMARNDLMVVSYVWYRAKRKKKRFYSKKLNQFFDYSEKSANIEEILYNIPDLDVVTVEVKTWNVAVVLNDVLMFQGENPLGFDKCPFIPVFWNYDPHINHPDLRVRSLTRCMRSPQFLFNYKVITNNDIAAATINAGWKRKSGAVANEDNLKKAGQGYDIIINEGYELSDCEKIIPSAVPESDLALAQQMADLIYNTSGINLENWSGQSDTQISALTAMIKQAANLMVFQKYFDQWDYALKLLGDLELQIVLHNWSAEKIQLIIGEEPTPHFYSHIFAKYSVLAEETDLTPTQQNLQAQQMFEINERFQREVFPPSMIIPKLNISGKAEVIEFLQQQEQQQQAQQEETSMIQHAFEEAKLQELKSKAVGNIAKAREDHARSESNLGLWEERLSMIERNRAISIKDKQEAISKLLENIQMHGLLANQMADARLEAENQELAMSEDQERMEVQRTTESNKFLEQLLGSGQQILQQPNMMNQDQMPQESGQMVQQPM